MAWTTLAAAREHLAAWMAADAAVATGQSYTIGSRTLTRADAGRIAERIAFWRRTVEQLQSSRSGVRVLRAVPRDT
ncbi:MAG: hypothetical protein FJ125_09675 [Deltaproteobacteria bacterium]|nr:hypothetical protein [Deltaproteobacteria bacterium]